MGWVMLVIGLLVALSASTLLVLGQIESGVAIAAGVLGIGLIAASGRWLPTKPGGKPREEKIEQTIFSPDHQVRALVRQHADGNYRVEIQKLIHDYAADTGSQNRWERQSNPIITDSLASAVEIAARSVEAGTQDFFGESES